MLDTQQYQRILIAVDGSESSENALTKAIEIAERNNSELIIAHVFDVNSYALGMIDTAGITAIDAIGIDMDKEIMENLLKEYKQRATKHNLKNVETIMVQGAPKIELTQGIPNDYHVDLIVVGQTGMNAVERWMMGSVSEHIIRHAPCDVLVVRNKKQDEEVNND